MEILPSSVAAIHLNKKSWFTIFPNPAKNYIKITGNNLQPADVLDNMGRILISKFISDNSNIGINILTLAKGSYIIRAKNKTGEVQTEQLIIY